MIASRPRTGTGASGELARVFKSAFGSTLQLGAPDLRIARRHASSKLAEHTLFAELIERSMDAMFDAQFAENGTFVERTALTRAGTARRYWYFQGYRPGEEADGKRKRYSRHVGPADDAAIAERIVRFRDIKAARGERARLVDALVGAGMPRPPSP